MMKKICMFITGAYIGWMFAVVIYQWGFEAGVINGGTLAAQGCR